jgi:hypothetical protein
MTEGPLFTPLAEDELQSLCWIATMSSRIAIPAAHILKLLDAGYIQESMRGPMLTALGEVFLSREMDARAERSGGSG